MSDLWEEVLLRVAVEVAEALPTEPSSEHHRRIWTPRSKLEPIEIEEKILEKLLLDSVRREDNIAAAGGEVKTFFIINDFYF